MWRVAIYARAGRNRLNRQVEGLATQVVRRIALLAREYGDQLDDLAEVLADFAAKIKAFGPAGYLQSVAHRDGEEAFVPPAVPDAGVEHSE